MAKGYLSRIAQSCQMHVVIQYGAFMNSFAYQEMNFIHPSLLQIRGNNDFTGDERNQNSLAHWWEQNGRTMCKKLKKMYT